MYTVPALVGSTLTTLSYQHWRWQMSGAPVCAQVEPPVVVTNTPRLVLEPKESPVAGLMFALPMEAYTVLPVVSEGAMPRSMRPIADVVGWVASAVKLIGLLPVQLPLAFVDL